MAVESTSDLEDMFSTDDFAETVTINGSTVSAILENREEEILGDYGIYKVALVRESDIDSAPHGDSVVISGTTYEIFNVNLDGTGLVELVLGPAQ